ncbi:hypothetical protein ACK6TD_17165 [Enterobacter hormaechei]|uniref:hypothetical protein n=1 Tax=Enterobacter hormaechei TaxID=158836 RepID=UPI003C2E76B2
MQDIHEKAPAEVVKINVGALKGACLKIEYEKVYYFQRFYMSCYVPIIAPSKSVVALHSRKSRSQIMAAGCTFSRHRFVPQRS